MDAEDSNRHTGGTLLSPKSIHTVLTIEGRSNRMLTFGKTGVDFTRGKGRGGEVPSFHVFSSVSILSFPRSAIPS